MQRNARFTLALIILCALFNFNGYASEVNFYHVNSRFGISMRETNAICKDRNGFIWASSKTGILRLTDDDYRIYQLPYEKPDVLTAKLIYVNSNVIVYTNNGQFFVYNELKDQFDRFFNVGSALNSVFVNVNSAIGGPDGSIYIASSRGFFELYNDQIVNLNEDQNDYLRTEWRNDDEVIISQASRFNVYNIKTKKKSTLFEIDDDLNLDASKLLMDRKNNVLWIGTKSEGIWFYDFKKDKLQKLGISSLPAQPVLALAFNTDSTIFAGIDGQGVWELNINSATVLNIYKENINNYNSLKGNGVYDIFKDENQRVWICTYSGGVSYFDQAPNNIEQLTHQINNTNSLVNNDVNRIIEDREGKLWMATNNGISCWNRQTNRWTSYYANKQEQAQVFLALCEDDLGRIWAGTYSSGVYVLDSKTGRELKHYSSKEKGSPINNNFILDILKDSNGDIWLGGVNEPVIRYKAKEDKFNIYNAQPLNVFAEYGDDKILMGCAYGLGITDKETNNSRIFMNGLLIMDLLVQDSIVWMCTSGNGLVKFNMNNYQRVEYNTESGLPSNFVNSILPNDGYFWLGTESGICRFNPKDESVLSFSSVQSLSGYSFNRNAVCKLSNGQLAWGSNNGIIIFNPNAVEETHYSGKIFFQDLSIAGRSVRDIPSINLNTSVNDLTEIKLKYNQNTIALELLPIGVAPGSRFSWKMEGLDENWSSPTNNRIVAYSNIKSRDFILKIRLYDSSLSHIIDERDLKIEVTPPFWSSWYFFVIVFMLVTSLIYLGLWYYINLIRQKHTEEKVRFFTNTAHDIRTALTLIKAPVEELSKEFELSKNGHYYLNLAKEQVVRLSSVVTQLMDFQKVDIGRGQLVLRNVDVVALIKHRILMFESLAQSKKQKLIFYSEQDSFISAVDEMKLEKIVDNLISNAIKYSFESGEVAIKLRFQDSKWMLDVTDQGIGINKKEQRQLFKEFYRGENAINTKIVGSGIGLLLVKNYVTLHGGSISFSSQENVGSSFQLTFPVKKVHDEVTVNEVAAELEPNLAKAMDLQPPELETPERTGAESELTVLIVEDNDDLRNFLSHALSDEFEVITAVDGEVALEIANTKIPDLIVSDIMMPNMDGYELCRRIKSTYETSHIPIILLTALTSKEDEMQGLGLGADDYLTKPFDIALLQQRIKSIIRNRQIVREKSFQRLSITNHEPILKNELNDQFIKKMMEVVQENLSNSNFNKDEFAAAMNVSPSLLYKKVKSLTDQSPTDFLKTIRLEHALELLQSNKYNVTEVSELCGFSSIGYFSTVFKKHFGKTPTEVLG